MENISEIIAMIIICLNVVKTNLWNKFSFIKNKKSKKFPKRKKISNFHKHWVVKTTVLILGIIYTIVGIIYYIKNDK